MRKLQKLILKNFQCWENQEILFDQGLNIIIGESDSGKSSILRAIISCFNGRIDVNWIRHGAKELVIEMWFTDGCKAIRTRGKKVNTVAFIDAEGKHNEWERIGTGLPEEYLRMLGDTQIKLSDGTSIDPCISTQLDPHFFLSLSDASKAKLLGSISGLDMIDGALSLIVTESREVQNKIKNTGLRVEELKTQKGIIGAEIIESEEFYKKFEVIDKDLYTKLETLKKIFELRVEIIEKNENLEVYEYESKKLEKVLKDLNANFDSLGKVKLLEKVSSLAQGITSAVNAIEIHGKQLELSTSVLSVLNKVENEVNDKVIILEKILTINEKIKRICIEEFKNVEKEIDVKIDLLKQENKEVFKDIKECPLCGQLIKNKEELCNSEKDRL